MHLEGRTDIAAPRQRVWDALVDPRQIAPCVPGRPDIEIVDERHFRIRVSVGGGLFKASATVDIALDRLTPPSHGEATASASAMGGSAEGRTVLDLEEPAPGRTTVGWAADITLGGMLSGFAAMAEGPARDGVERTLDCIKARLENGPA